MGSYPVTDRTRVRRLAERGKYDKETVYSILDEAFLCHLGFIAEGKPVVIPTLYGRDGDRLYIHGSAANHMHRTLAQGTEMCLTVTLVDGLVLARSAFHMSVNYRYSAPIPDEQMRADIPVPEYLKVQSRKKQK